MGKKSEEAAATVALGTPVIYTDKQSEVPGVVVGTTEKRGDGKVLVGLFRPSGYQVIRAVHAEEPNRDGSWPRGSFHTT